jgi:hypothetical protein
MVNHSNLIMCQVGKGGLPPPRCKNQLKVTSNLIMCQIGKGGLPPLRCKNQLKVQLDYVSGWEGWLTSASL